MEVFMYVAYLDQANALFLYFVVRIRRRGKKFTFAISFADDFLVFFVIILAVSSRIILYTIHNS